MIRGHCSLATSALSQLDAITVSVIEAINALPGVEAKRTPFASTKLVRFDKGGGTPTFTFEDVPFSPYGSFVSAFAPGLNGSERIVHLTKESPRADVVLAITCGVPFSVIVRDQLQTPLADLMVALIPDGAPLGRPLLEKKSNSYGSVLFESVLRGPYQVIAGPRHAPLCEPKLVDVQADGGRNVQCANLVVPRGSDLKIEVFGPQCAAIKGTAGVDVQILFGCKTVTK